MPTVIDPGVKEAAHARYLTGSELAAISRELGVKKAVIEQWITRGKWQEERERLRKEVVAEIVRDVMVPKKDLIKGIVEVGLGLVKKALDDRAESLQFERLTLMEARVISSIITDIEKLQGMEPGADDPLKNYAPVTLEQLKKAIANDPFIQAVPLLEPSQKEEKKE